MSLTVAKTLADEVRADFPILQHQVHQNRYALYALILALIEPGIWADNNHVL